MNLHANNSIGFWFGTFDQSIIHTHQHIHFVCSSFKEHCWRILSLFVCLFFSFIWLMTHAVIWISRASWAILSHRYHHHFTPFLFYFKFPDCQSISCSSIFRTLEFSNDHFLFHSPSLAIASCFPFSSFFFSEKLWLHSFHTLHFIARLCPNIPNLVWSDVYNYALYCRHRSRCIQYHHHLHRSKPPRPTSPAHLSLYILKQVGLLVLSSLISSHRPFGLAICLQQFPPATTSTSSSHHFWNLFSIRIHTAERNALYVCAHVHWPHLVSPLGLPFAQLFQSVEAPSP